MYFHYSYYFHYKVNIGVAAVDDVVVDFVKNLAIKLFYL